jgi:predicted nucleic acid-binding protein
MNSDAIVLADTSVWIDFFRAEPGPGGRRLHELIVRGTRCCVCGPVVAEVLQGIRDARAYRRIAAALSAFEYLEDDGRDTWVAAAETYRTCRAMGVTPRSLVDVFIARVAVAHDVVLLHDDRDYDGIARALPSLVAIRPS